VNSQFLTAYLAHEMFIRSSNNDQITTMRTLLLVIIRTWSISWPMRQKPMIWSVPFTWRYCSYSLASFWMKYVLGRCSKLKPLMATSKNPSLNTSSHNAFNAWHCYVTFFLEHETSTDSWEDYKHLYKAAWLLLSLLSTPLHSINLLNCRDKTLSHGSYLGQIWLNGT